MLFAIIAFDRENSAELRMATRPSHFDYARATGVVKLGGPFLSEGGKMIGSLIIIEAPDLTAAQDWQRNDPYAKAGLFAQAQVRPWKATANHCGAEL